MRVVLDASVLVEILMASPRGQRAAGTVRLAAGDVHLPHLADVEVISVLRELIAAQIVTPQRAIQALGDLRDFPAKRWPAHPLVERAWELRENLTAYDATYVALAEALDATLVTADSKLAHGAQGLARCEIAVVA